ncbi:MAG: hypothetical protein M3160_03955 [Candidatus Eremiobacteraeota bacterium]|nr:hypothetical protein [Candidatus Eremiobacteraeota bacterium]
MAEIALRPSRTSCGHDGADDILTVLRHLLPYAACAGGLLHIASTYVDNAAPIGAPLALAGGLLLGFFTSPCALGTVVIAAALCRTQPLAALGILSVGGIADVSTLRRPQAREASHDWLAYVLCALACAGVAMRHGDALVHPRFTQPLWACAASCAYLSWRHRSASGGGSPRLAPTVMLASLLVGAPAPSYQATETTITNAFAGEHLDFIGMVTNAGGRCALVRYAIVCCRADAQPIVVRLHGRTRLATGSWMRASGTLVEANGELSLQLQRIRHVAPPADPFVYR